jgi:NAD(P)-dependent dehydrogenase (short-subunit alcohol dehydrogenase family)
MSVFRDGLFTGKSAFFTGGSSGIGLAIAERFASLGARVCLLGRNQDKLSEAVEGIRRAGGLASDFACDVRDYAAIEDAVGRAAGSGPLDFVFAAAAGNFPAPAAAMSANGFKAVIDIDALGTFNVYKAAYPHLRKPGAVLVSISANHATQPFAQQAHVCAAKAAVELLTKTLALEWGPEGVRAVCIQPGPIDETEGMRRLAPTPAVRDAVRAAVPLGRFGAKSEIAALAVFLCSDAAAYITGATIACDGGAALAGPRLLVLAPPPAG